MPFRNAILAGIVLIREAIQSPNYTPGVSGWTINQDGTAEFSDLTIRSSDGSGNTIELNNGCVQLYNSLAVLVAELCASIPGLRVGAAGEPQVIIYSDGADVGRVEFDANSPSSGTNAALTEVVFDDGAADEHISFQLQGPGADGATDRLELLLNSQNADGSSEANFLLRVGSGGMSLISADKVQGVGSHAKLTVVPPAASDSCFLIAADSSHTGSYWLAQKGATEKARLTSDARLTLNPESSINSAIFVNAASGYTGNLFRLAINASDMATVDAAGALTTRNLRHGTAQTPAPGAGGGTSTVAVTFAVAMSGTPRVTIDPVTTVDPATVNIQGYVDAVSSTGFTIRAFRSTNSATNWSYTAMST